MPDRQKKILSSDIRHLAARRGHAVGMTISHFTMSNSEQMTEVRWQRSVGESGAGPTSDL